MGWGGSGICRGNERWKSEGSIASEERCGNGGDQGFVGERLGQDGRDTQLAKLTFVMLIDASAGDEDGQLGAHAPESLHELDPAEVGHVEVGDDKADLGTPFDSQNQPLGAVASGDDLESE